MVATRQPISGLVNMLGNHLDRPVTDMTGLKGTYDFTLDFAPDDGTRMGRGMPMMMPPPPPGEGGGGANPPEAPNGPSLYTALEEQLGLKLEPRKGPVDLLVIDHAEKVPTEN